MGYKMKGFSGFKNSPVKQKAPKMPKNHPVTPPTEEQSKKSKGTFNSKFGLISHGTWDRPGVKASFKEEWGKVGDIISTDVKKVKKYIKSKFKK